MVDFNKDYSRSISIKENIVQGENFRFTVLTPRLIRMEYSPTGHFVDKPTQFAKYRDNERVRFEAQDNDKYVLIRTKYFQVTYLKNKPFAGNKVNPAGNLKVELLNTIRSWHYGYPEVRNYGAPSTSFDNNKNKIKLKRGLYSVEGFASYDDSDAYIIDETNELKPKSEKSVDIYLFMYLNDYLGALSDYYYLTGYPPLIPRYAFGNWWSRGINYNDNSLKDVVDEFAEKEIPLSVVLLDKQWHINEIQGKRFNTGFSWNNQNFSNPKLMIDYLHGKKLRLGLNVNPAEGILPYEKKYEDFCKILNISPGEIIPFNVYDFNFIKVYFTYLINPLYSDGVDFFWIDADDVKNKDILWGLNEYHRQFDNAINKRPFTLTRNPNIAEHRYPVTYSGKTIVSWDTLKMIPKYNILATDNGNSFWAHDIGGYHEGMEDNELYTRFVQLGTFSPILKFGSDGGKFYKREPWKWSYKTYKITKDFLKLRHSLIPYIYSEAYKYHKDAKPLIIPLYYEQPEAYDDKDYNTEYYFGSEFFISPILKSKDYVMNRVVHKVYLPAGTWFDYVTGKKYNGGKEYYSFFKDEDYPIYVRDGSIIPLAHNDDINDTSCPVNMEIQIFPGKSNAYDLYEDDGITNSYENGEYLITNIAYRYSNSNYSVTIKPKEGKRGIIPEKRNYKFVFRNMKKAENVSVTANTLDIPYKAYSKKTSFIIEVANVSTNSELSITCKGNDMEISSERIFMKDIESIISDLQINTVMKERIDQILTMNDTIKKKRIAIRKLQSKGLERKFVKLFLNLLGYFESH